MTLREELEMMVEMHQKMLEGRKTKTKYVCYEEVVLTEGQEYDPPAKPRPKGLRKGRDKFCFRNSWTAAMNNGWTYVEGYAQLAGIGLAVAHAWCLDDDGNVVETTWKTAGEAYFGIPMELDWVNEFLLKTGHYGVLVNDWMYPGKEVPILNGMEIRKVGVK